MELLIIEREGAEVMPLPERKNKQDSPQIHIASIGDYNDLGEINGKWVDATLEPVVLEAEAQDVVRASKTGSPLWGVYDTKGFYGLELDAEWQDLGYVHQLATGIQEYGEAFAKWTQVRPDRTPLVTFESSYIGHFASADEYSSQLVDEFVGDFMKTLPEDIRPYIGFDAIGYAKGLEESGAVAIAPSSEEGVHVFAL
jgi:antirestriction protein